MKTNIIYLCLIFSVFSCEMDMFDKDKKDNLCPIVANNSVPQTVMSSFNLRYSESVANVTWFDKDNVSYCAIFKQNGKETKACFQKDGQFMNEKVEQNSNGMGCNEDEDDDDDDSGCQCEVDDDAE